MEGEQHNLILTQTYDTLIGLYGLVDLGKYAVVGTGSAAPDPSQTGLVNEVARTGADTSPPLSGEAEPAPGQAVFTRVREFTEAQVGGRNLTEWGFSPAGVPGGNLMSRELFRDGSGNPVVLTLAPDQRLRLIYRYAFNYAPAIGTTQNVSVNISGLGVKTAKLFISRYEANIYIQTGHIYLLSDWARGHGIVKHAPLSGYSAPNPDARPFFRSEHLIPIDSLGTTPITRGRKINARTFNAAEANMTWYGLALIRGSAFEVRGVVFLMLDPGQEFAKESLYKLTVNEWVLTWGP